MRPAYSPAAEQGQAGAQCNLGVMCDMSTAVESQHLKVAGSAVIPNADPTTQAAAALKMALRAVLLSGQAPATTAQAVRGPKTNRTARFPRC